MESNQDPNVALRAMVQIRGLSEGGSRTPVRKFEGNLTAILPRMDTSRSPQRLFIDLRFTECVIIETVPGEAFPFEVVELSIRYSDRKSSAWGEFAETLTGFIAEDQEIWDCQGMRMQLHAFEKDYGPDRANLVPDPANPGQMVPGRIRGMVWRVMSVAGSGSIGVASSNGSSAAMERALSILDGKTIGQFNDEVWSDPLVKSDPSLSSMLLNGNWASTMEVAGRVKLDEAGVYHLVVA